MVQIFISYHHADQPLVDEMAKLLRSRRHEVVYSGSTLSPGTEWRSAIWNWGFAIWDFKISY